MGRSRKWQLIVITCFLINHVFDEEQNFFRDPALSGCDASVHVCYAFPQSLGDTMVIENTRDATNYTQSVVYFMLN